MTDVPNLETVDVRKVYPGTVALQESVCPFFPARSTR